MPDKFIFNIHAAQTAQQKLVTERLEITPPLDAVVYPDANTATRFMRLKASPGMLDLRYAARRIFPRALLRASITAPIRRRGPVIFTLTSKCI